ncbi:response regulator [Psychrobacter sp. NG25]|uniref:response regulator n=1 Tax=Psychrobacter sp. NG25 TaxID=2782005 RepID=UPI0018841F03|nr:hybrid sensor histidine kinase/response regulator [Psychrobacter sp. NG25]MBF0657608.1 response regulator [Psychrobacter sp. NG25]
MQQFQSLKRLLIFYALTLLVMLVLYYFTLFHEIKTNSEQQSINTFYSLQHEITEHAGPLNPEIDRFLKQLAFEGISYQLVFMMPSGQTYIHRYTRPNERAFPTVSFPTITSSPIDNSSHSAYKLNSSNLTGTIKLKSGHQIYIILRHKPLIIDWISYRYWLPLMTAIILFVIALLYMLNRRINWEQLISYTDSLNSHKQEVYSTPPFLYKKSTPEFLRLGHALSRVSYQLHSNYRRIKTLTHRLERLVNQAPLPMIMIMRHGQISFCNQRFDQIFICPSESDKTYELTDFVAGKDESTQSLLQTLSNLRVTRTLSVYGLKDKQAYQLNITPWFGEHGQVHGFTVIFNNINEIVKQNEQLQQKNKQLKSKLDEFYKLRLVIGHKLRVPIEAMIDTLEPIDPNNLDARQNRSLDILIRNSQDMLTLINDTLHVGNIEVRKSRLNIEPVDIYKLTKEANNLVINDIRQQGLELIYFFAPDCPRYIDTDGVRLRHILLDLLKNAIKFTTSGYVALTIDRVTEEQVKRVNNDRVLPTRNTMIPTHASHWIHFSIKDTGIGIDADKKNQLITVFNKETNLDNNKSSQATEQAGTGLDNANSFAQLLGGFIELKSTMGKESIFNVYLPCRRPNYQPVYHQNQHLSGIHLIAVIEQPLVAENLQRLCKHLAIPMTIHTAVDLATLRQLTNTLVQNQQMLTPILLLDYEYYKTITLTDNDDNSQNIETDIVEKQIDWKYKTLNNSDKLQALNDLLATPLLPKLLFSMKPERHIPSVLLDKYDGFLTKPLDANLLVSELLRLTISSRQKLTAPISCEKESNQQPIDIAEPKPETLSPLILVAEDSPTNQKITCKILSKLGYRSVVAEDGQQALHKLKEQRQDISLILMDCRMPVMDGLQATRAIRAQDDDIPIVALTANNAQEDRDACMHVGMDDFLSKPINKKELEAVLGRLIEA